MKRLGLCFLLLCGCLSAQAARWVRGSDQRTRLPDEILKGRKNWGVDLEAGLRAVEGNTQSKAVNGGLSFYKVAGLSTYYADVIGLYAESSDKVIENHLNGALRWDRRCFEDPNWRFFIFNTHGFNEFTKLDYRATLGAGFWYDWKGESWLSSWSVAPSYFYEEFEQTAPQREWRFSFRNVFSRRLSEHSQIGYDFFYIPKADDAGDFQIFFAPFVQADVYQDFLAIKLSASLEHDSRPQPGVKKTDRAYFASLVISFGD